MGIVKEYSVEFIVINLSLRFDVIGYMKENRFKNVNKIGLI